MKKGFKILFAGAVAASLAACSSSTPAATTEETAAAETAETVEKEKASYTSTAIAQGFDAHKDCVVATATVDQDGTLTNLSIDEYLGIRSIARIVNNLQKANEEELAFVESIPDEDKVFSEDEKYADYKYLLINGNVYECENAGDNLYVGISEGAVITDLLDYYWTNPEAYYNEVILNTENGAILKLADEGEEVIATAGDLEFAKLADLHSFYGTLSKKDGYSKKFSEAGTTTAWADSMAALESYILENDGVSEDLSSAANADTTEGFLDLVTGATFGYPSMYVNAASEAIENARAQVK